MPLPLILNFAERQGFEPWEQLPVHRISSAARSTTPATFLKSGAKVVNYLYLQQYCLQKNGTITFADN